MQIENVDASSLVSIIVMVIAPLAVALVTKQSWPNLTRNAVLLAISAVVAFLNTYLQLDDGQTWNWTVALINTVIAYIIGLASYLGLWKQTPLPETLQGVAVKDSEDANA